MSKSSSLNRSSSTDTENDPETASIKDPLTSSIVEEDNQNTTIKSTNSTDNLTSIMDPNDNREEEKTMPISPPPSYEFVLKETRLKKQESDQSPTTQKTPDIIHKSSKEFYKAVAKQFGITCKMSDQCRCYDCQSHYFDCEYEQNEQEKTDGGLGAGTPVFLHEVMHGSACIIL